MKDAEQKHSTPSFNSATMKKCSILSKVRTTTEKEQAGCVGCNEAKDKSILVQFQFQKKKKELYNVTSKES